MATTDLKAKVQEALRKKMMEEGLTPKAEEPAEAKKKVEDPTFKTEGLSHEGKTPYHEIIGEYHPNDPKGEKYFFTVHTVEEWDEDIQSLIPETNPDHQFDHDYALAILMGIEYNKSVFAYGPPGSGKSVTPAQVCARINYPFMFIAGMGGTEPSDYVGQPWVVEGSMDWKDGPASYAVRKGVFLLYDEPFKASAQTNMCFQSLLDTRKTLKLYGHPDPIQGNLVAHPNFRIALADNVQGIGDNMDKYAAEIQDQSTLNRTAYKVHVDYVPAKVEGDFLKARFAHALSDKAIDRVVSVAGMIRNGWKKGDISMPYSLRDTQELCEAAIIHQSMKQAFAQTYYGYISDDSEKKAVRDIWNMAFTGEEAL